MTAENAAPNPLLIECGHCPASTARWLVVGDHDAVVKSMDEHIHRVHPNTGQWIEDDDWAILNEADVIAQADFLAAVPTIWGVGHDPYRPADIPAAPPNSGFAGWTAPSS
jgi:hypothetical protein